MFIHIENFHQNADQFAQIINGLEFTAATFGDEIQNFNHTPPEVLATLEKIVGMELKYGEGSGVFRKPHEFIHYENFGPNSVYVGFVALEDNNFKILKNKETNSNFILEISTNIEEFIKNNCFDATKWDTVADIQLQKGNLLLIQPFQFHKLEKKLVQVFYLERKNSLQRETTDQSVVKENPEESVVSEDKPKKGRKKKS
jgi:hypothetical protein